MNHALLFVGILVGGLGTLVGLSGTRSIGDLMIVIAIIVPGCAAAVAGYLGLRIEKQRDRNHEVKPQ